MAELSNKRDPAEADERRLVTAARQGDPNAMGRLLLHYQDRVFRTALHLLGGDHDAASDAAQEALVNAWRNIGQFRGESRFSTWIYRIAVNTTKNVKVATGRRASRETSMDDRGYDEDAPPAIREPADKAPNPGKQAEEKEMIELVREKIAGLAPEFRDPLVLRYIEDRPYEEIAEILDTPLGTIKSRISRGRRDLRKAMDEHLGTTTGGGS